MRDLHPLADCWIQMLLIKKKIRRRSIRLNKYKLRGRKRVQVMRKLRDELLQSLRTLIDVKLEKIRLSKRRGGRGRMVRLYRSCLYNWQKYLKNQQIKLKEMEQEEDELDRQLRLLRKQLKILPNRRHLLTQYLKDFGKALDIKESGRKYQTRKDNHIMKMELEKIISFLLNRKDKHVNRSKFEKLEVKQKKYKKSYNSALSIGGTDNIDLSKFWKLEVKRKKSKHLHKPLENAMSIGSIGKSAKPRKNKIVLPKIRDLHRIKDELDTLDKIDAPNLKKVLHKVKVQHSKWKPSIIHSRVPLKDALNLSVNLRKDPILKNKKEENLFNAKSAIENFENEMQVSSLISKLSTRTKQKVVKKLGGKKDRKLQEVEQIVRRTIIDKSLGISRYPSRSVLKGHESATNTTNTANLTNAAKTDNTANSGHTMKSKNADTINTARSTHNVTHNIHHTPTGLRKKSFMNIGITSLDSDPASQVSELLKNKSVTPGVHTYQDQRNPHWRLFQRILLSKKRNRLGTQLLTMLELVDQAKLRPIQELLKDVIKGPTMLDILADKEEILKTVAKHYMWKNLANVYYDLTSVGVSKPEIYNVLKKQYLKYIDEIVGEAIQKGAKVIVASQLSSLTLKKSMRSFDSFEDYLSKRRPKQELAMRKTLAEIKELPSPPYPPMRHPEPDALSILSMEIQAYNNHVNMLQRYSATNLRNIYDAHARYFDSLAKHPKDSRMSEGKRREAAIARDLLRNAKAKAKRNKRKQQQKFDSTRLYYEPRKTCRERSIEDVKEVAKVEAEAEREKVKECSCELSKCSRCGVELPPPTATPWSSSSESCLRSTAACGKNKSLPQFSADICDRCGFVHDQHTICPMLIESSTSKTMAMQQLRLIKEISGSFSQQSSLSAGTSLQRICREFREQR